MNIEAAIKEAVENFQRWSDGALIYEHKGYYDTMPIACKDELPEGAYVCIEIYSNKTLSENLEADVEGLTPEEVAEYVLTFPNGGSL